MGNSSFRSGGPHDTRNFLQTDFPKFIYQNQIGNGKFMKTYLMTVPVDSTVDGVGTRSDGVQVVIKVYVRSPDEDLAFAAKHLTRLWKTLSPTIYPNLLPYQLWMRSTSRFAKTNAAPAYLIRQHLFANLHDRISTRPFLSRIEKLWILFQLFKCLEIAHSHGIAHGDVKPENVMCTTWNWVVLTDFATSFKPTIIPDDDPTDFQYYFDGSNRSVCYVAPERFSNPGSSPSTPLPPDSSADVPPSPPHVPSPGSRAGNWGARLPLTEAMDVFSLGCTIAELWLDGEGLLDLPGMVRYKAGSAGLSMGRLDHEDSPARASVNKIRGLVQAVVVDMTQIDPLKRRSVEQYRQIFEGSLKMDSEKEMDYSDGEAGADDKSTIFPAYFRDTLYPLFLQLHWQGVTPDDRIGIVCENYSQLMTSITGRVHARSARFFRHALGGIGLNSQSELMHTSLARIEAEKTAAGEEAVGRRVARSLDVASLQSARRRGEGECKALLCETIEVAAGPPTGPPAEESWGDGPLSLDELLERCKALIQEAERTVAGEQGSGERAGRTAITPTAAGLAEACSAAMSDAPLCFFDFSVHSRSPVKRTESAGSTVVVQLILSNFRHLKYPQAKMVSLMLLADVGQHCSDEIILQRITPFLLSALDDACALVRATAIKALRFILSLVQTFTAYEANIFPQYVFPAINRSVTSPGLTRAGLARDPDVAVRAAFAESVGRLAETAKRFLDRAHMTALAEAVARQGEDTDAAVVNFAYDKKLKHLHDTVSRWVRELVVAPFSSSNSGKSEFASSEGSSRDSMAQQTDARHGSGLSSHTSLIKRVLLLDIARLCTFFGQESTVDLLLTQLLTYLNDQDWELRYAFCSKISSVCAFVGSTVTSDCILPCIEKCLVDVEDRVVLCALQCLTSLMQMGLLTTAVVVETVKGVTALLLHPAGSIRNAAIDLVAAAVATIGRTDTFVVLLPLLLPLLRHDLTGVDVIDAEVLRLSLVAPVSPGVYKKALLARQEELEDEFGGPSNGSKAKDAPAPAPHPMNAADEAKLSLMRRYLDTAARELHTKTIQWRNGLRRLAADAQGRRASTRTDSPFYAAALGRHSRKTQGLDSILNLSLSHLDQREQKPRVQKFLIPNEKFGIQYFPAVSDSVRNTLVSLENAKSASHIKLLYGITENQGEVARALSSVGTGEQWEALPAAADTAASGSGDLQRSVGGPLPKVDLKAALPFAESRTLLKRIKALDVPPLPPDFGPVYPSDRAFYASESALNSGADAAQSRVSWRPKENLMVSSLHEHTRAVNRFAVSADHSFFASASADKTVKIWQTRGLDYIAYPRSALTYSQHSGPVLDIAMVENSHSIASCSGDGSVHVWRVDVQRWQEPADPGPGPNPGSSFHHEGFSTPTSRAPGLSVSGTSVIKTLDPAEGSVVCIQHFNSDLASMLIFATQSGKVHGWDLRCSREVFELTVRPELGVPTAMTLGSDRNWICVGTSRGYLCLWDIRYGVLSKLWRHSSHGPVHRLACCKALQKQTGREAMPATEGAYLFIAAGHCEAAVWALPEGGECLKCFRSIPLAASSAPLAPLPQLHELDIPRSSGAPVAAAVNAFVADARRLGAYRSAASELEPTIRAIVGKISSSSSSSYLITAGTDRSIRYWDFNSPSKCYTVSGLEPAQPKGAYESSFDAGSRLCICYDTALPSAGSVMPAHIPVSEGRGPVGAGNTFRDAVLDLKCIDYPVRLLLAGSRDGTIKLFK